MSSLPKLPELYEELMHFQEMLRFAQRKFRLHNDELLASIIAMTQTIVDNLREQKDQVDRANFQKMLKMKKQLPESVQAYIDDEWNDLLSYFGESA